VNAVDRFTSASLGDWDWRGALEDVTVRLLILHGTADPLPLEGACQWTEAIPGARVLFLEGIGHFPYLEAPEEFFEAVRCLPGWGVARGSADGGGFQRGL
jgi:pimeloyl-ACP methyl ester carboxylesterase